MSCALRPRKSVTPEQPTPSVKKIKKPKSKRTLFYQDLKKQLDEDPVVVEYADIFHPDEPPRLWRVQIEAELDAVPFGPSDFQWSEQRQQFVGPR